MISIAEPTETSQTHPQVIIHPTMDCWPTNILRAHIVFDRPMQTTDAVRHIKLTDSDGSDISDALLDLSDGLWTADQQTLTVLFHPGRIKTGLVAGDLYGPTFAVGHTYQLAVSKGIVSADGQGLERSYCHHFRAVPPIEQCLPITDKLALTEKTTCIDTALPLDFLSAQAYLAVTDEQGNRTPAQVSIAADGRSISVHLPDTHREGNCVLRVHPNLEDIAGNRVSSPFERSECREA